MITANGSAPVKMSESEMSGSSSVDLMTLNSKKFQI